jgi:sugar/nucleoside kinase (ribokinase family)
MTIVVQNRYYIRPGPESEGLATRRQASSVRAHEGRPTGRILVSTGPQEGDPPTFIWECEYPGLDARQSDLDWAAASEAFTAVRRLMGTLLEHFERLTFEVDEA